MHYFLTAALMLSIACYAEEGKAYRTGGPEFSAAWHQFYDLADHEPEIDDPLIEKGAEMVPAIIEAVRHKDMKRRRYAIGALGQIKCKAAIELLEDILKDKSELEHFRSDALHAIYRIDQELGTKLASEFKSENSYLRMISEEIFRRAAWPLERTEEGE